jgi:hypothetical protein
VEIAEHEERYIRDYVNSQSPENDQAGLVQKVGSRRILGRVHEIYDVHCTSTRWWVITNPTNLYLQTDFPEAQQALMFHIGLGVMMAERSRSELDAEEEEHISTSWRRYRQAVLAMNEAAEAEDYQAVGIKCRDTLLALAKSQVDAEWLGEVTDPPKAADFKSWANIFAEHLAEGRMRAYVKGLVDKTWDLTVWLQHCSSATEYDADIVLDATAHLLGAFGKLIRRHESGEPERCPRCDSYKLDDDIQQDDSRKGFFESAVCGACGWRSEAVFTSWADHFRGADIEPYLSGPSTGISDRPHRNDVDASKSTPPLSSPDAGADR